jgi:hypothetical protein
MRCRFVVVAMMQDLCLIAKSSRPELFHKSSHSLPAETTTNQQECKPDRIDGLGGTEIMLLSWKGQLC